MPVKVSPRYFIQLCQRVKILHKGKRKSKGTGEYISRAQVKGTGNIVLLEPK